MHNFGLDNEFTMASLKNVAVILANLDKYSDALILIDKSISVIERKNRICFEYP